MSEEIIYSDNSVSVSTSRVVIKGTTYALRNITSVKMTVTPAKQGCAIALIIGGVIWAIAIIGSKGGAAGAFVIGGIVIGLGILWFRSAKPEYHVTIASSAQEISAHNAKDRAYIEKIVGAINEAIVRYR